MHFTHRSSEDIEWLRSEVLVFEQALRILDSYFISVYG
jgi:hypothetical protein